MRTRPFVLLAAGQAVSRLGDGLFATALAWIALQSRGTAGVALVTSAATAPLLLGSVIGASWSDRHDRRRLMIGTDLLRLVLLLGLAAALERGPVPLWALAGFALAEGSASAVFAPGPAGPDPGDSPARVPDAGERDHTGLLHGQLRNRPAAPWPAAGGHRHARRGRGRRGDLRRVRRHPGRDPAGQPGPRADGRPGMRQDLAAGWRAVRAAPDVLLVLGTFVAALILASGFLAVGLPAWVSRAHGGPGTLGLLQGAAGAAELAGALC